MSDLKLVGKTINNTTYIDPMHELKVQYNLQEMEDFLDMVFHAGLTDEEHIAMWDITPRKPALGYPVSEDDVLNTIFNGTYNSPRVLYYATSTIRLNDQGQLRHRNDNFVSYRVLVLDDIGTKVALEDLPEGLRKPTYKIESSQGNFQYGYVLKNPITELAEARALVDLAYSSGYSDGGGNLAVKAVRLPAGVNGKVGDKGLFQVRLTELNDILWEPEQLVKLINSEVTWDELKADAEKSIKRTQAKALGATIWSHAKHSSTEGIVDPVLEWLYTTGRVFADNGMWVTVQCPNHAEHSMGDGTAGYRPLGRGDDPHSRGFHCLHGHCQHLKTGDFLEHVAKQNGPFAAVRDEAAGLTSTWVYDANDDSAVDVRTSRYPQRVKMVAFKTLYNKMVPIITSDGKEKLIPEHKLWVDSGARVNIFGQCFDASTESRLVQKDGRLLLNIYTPPMWGAGSINKSHLTKFFEFLEYLVPNKDEREFLYDHLAAKAQNMAYRGPCITMVAEQQGTGRTTLADMLMTLFDQSNVSQTPFKDVISENPFNEWQAYPIVICDETLDAGDGVNPYKAYERIKEIVDPRTKQTMINPKYGKKFLVECCTSLFLFSNHSNAVSMAANDRRIYVVRNAQEPADSEYFRELNEWLRTTDMNGNPEWAPSVWRWLRDRTVDLAKLHEPPVQTSGKKMMMIDSSNPLQAAVTAVLKHLKEPYVSSKFVEDMVSGFAMRLDLDVSPNWRNQVRRKVKEMTGNYDDLVLKVAGASVRPRYVMSHDIKPVSRSLEHGELLVHVGSGIRRNSEEIESIREAVSDELDLLDL